MREVAIVLTFKRPEMLSLCLEAIRKADSKIELHVFPDRGRIVEEKDICEKFNAVCHLTLDHNYHGNSANMLEALKWSFQNGYDRTFVIEDDSIVKKDFFSWSRNALDKHPEAFAACGWVYSPHAPKQYDGPDMMINWYLSVASCIPKSSLEHIVQHARAEYYADMGAYLDRAYPNSHRRGSGHYEQDGLCLRVAESMSKLCVWPRQAKTVHVGWHGYHMPLGKPTEGTLEDRIAQARFLLEDEEVLKRAMASGILPVTDSCVSCGKRLLSIYKKAIAVCVQCFHHQHPELPVTSASHYYFSPGTESVV